MKTLVALGLMFAGVAGPLGAADAVFSQTLRAEEFSRAGLGKLSPEELAALDGLVRDFNRAAAPAPAATPEARAPRPAEPKSEGGPLTKARVVLAPGTQVDYAAVESRLVGEFRGWEHRTVLTLENGQRWRVISDEGYSTPALPSPAVKITPGMLGTFWMTIEGVKVRAKVAPITAR